MELKTVDATLELRNGIKALVDSANVLRIETDADVETAIGLTRAVKTLSKDVKDYFEPLRLQTKIAYDAVIAEKKLFTDPLDAAEKTLKNKVLAYDAEKQRKAREAEEAMRRAAQIEAEKKLAEAQRMAAEGDALGAEMAELDAEALSATAEAVSVTAEVAKADGMSRRKSWTISSIDPSKVPVEFAGMVLRPVDEKAVMALIKASKGMIRIPGVEYVETSILSVR